MASDDKILTRMGDGERVELSPSDIREDIRDGTADAARRGTYPLDAIRREVLRVLDAATGGDTG